LFENDLKSKSQFKNLISNRDFKVFDFKSYPTLVVMYTVKVVISRRLCKIEMLLL